MFTRAVAPIVVAYLAACGGPTVRAPRSRLTPKEIVEASKPAIVRIDAGGDRVGTGFVVEASGLVVTNLHVVAGTATISVRMLDGSVYPVQRIAGIDPGRDLALLDIDPPRPLAALRLGNSATVAAGDPVLAIGNPMGVFDYTVSDGLISSVRVTDDVTVLQISAPISQGSSGGPLFNPFGEVIGVATAIFAAGQNLNFGIPSNYLRPLLATPGKISLAEFASKTRIDGREPGKPEIQIVRQVPVHELAVLDGCDKLAIEGLAEAISHTISSGAPLYNAGNHEACYRIYEGTVMKYERDAACAGVRAALHSGLLRAQGLGTFTEKAWALRDTFDGLIDVLVRHAQLNP